MADRLALPPSSGERGASRAYAVAGFGVFLLLQVASLTAGQLGKLETADEALVIQFNESVKGSAEFTDDEDRLDTFISGLQAWGGTSLYDAIKYALERIKDRPGRKAVLVFSDGDDTTSSIGQDEVVNYARAVEATVYTVGIRGSGPGSGPPSVEAATSTTTQDDTTATPATSVPRSRRTARPGQRPDQHRSAL